MTKSKAFSICFIIPSVILGLLALLWFKGSSGSDLSLSSSDLVTLLLLPLLLISIFVPARVIGGEFKKYGDYGALASAGLIIITFLILAFS
ncbi:MAG: hypothetical protein Q7S05_04185 [bacterium]|nr:hypothetical protein [bacterium]